MHHSPFRRSLLFASLSLPLIGIATPLFASSDQSVPLTLLKKKLAELERSSGGILGLSAVNTKDDRQFNYRADERFPFCSTFKAILVAAVLEKSMSDNAFLNQRIAYRKDELVVYSPVTEKHITGGMTVFDLCAAAMIYSDNTAANLLIKLLGGPEAVNQFARSIGDKSFNLSRWEPELNSAIPGDLSDTSTPAAMRKSLRTLALGDTLGPVQREQFITWLKSNTTGNDSIRAGVPQGWIVGDKTGSGAYGTTNDIAILWPPADEPIIIAIYFTQSDKHAKSRKDVLASATRIVIDCLK